MQMELSKGQDEGGPRILAYQKPWGCPLSLTIPTGEDSSLQCPCCCMLPELSTKISDGKELKSKYICDCTCVPKFSYSEDGEEVYRLKPETCCGGCCICYRCQKSMPFYFYTPD